MLPSVSAMTDAFRRNSFGLQFITEPEEVLSDPVRPDDSPVLLRATGRRQVLQDLAIDVNYEISARKIERIL